MNELNSSSLAQHTFSSRYYKKRSAISDEQFGLSEVTPVNSWSQLKAISGGNALLKLINFGNAKKFVKFLRTVVGSFPPKKLPLDDAVKWAVDIQLKQGIDLVSDGEQRTDMTSYFGSLPGLGSKPGGPYVKSRILPLENPKDFVKLQDLAFVRDYLRSKGREDVKAKVSITGPVTLGFSCAYNGLEHYSSIRDMKLYSDFAQALNPLIKEIAKTGCHVQIDEPSLSARVMNTKEAVEIVNEALSDLPTTLYEEGKVSVHICGAFNEPLFNDFMNLDAPILSLAFSAQNVRRNLEVVSKRILQSGQKKLGVGCVSVQAARKEEVEKLDAVIGRIETIKDRIGKEMIAFLHPDCGLRNTAEEAVEPILEVLASSASSLEKDG
jgi:5-methyltetrahydropteroyltriglutamate--homocysteine methyltransferase